MIAALRLARSHRALRRLLLLQALSRCADAAVMAVLTRVVVIGLEHGVTPASLGTSVVVASAPALVVGPIGGMLVDGLPARRLLGGVHVARAILMALAVAVPLLASTVIGYSIGGALLVLGGISVTARAAALPRLVDADDLVTANAGTSLVSRAAGPVGVAAGVAIGGRWPAIALVVAAVAEALAAAGYARFASRLDRPASGRASRGHRRAPVVRCAHVRRCITSVLGQRMLFGACFAAVVLLLAARYEMSVAGYASAMSVTGAAGLAGTLLAPRVARGGARRRLLVVSSVVPAVALWAAAIHPHTVLVLAAMGAAAGCLQVLRLVTEATIQRRVGERDRGHVVAWFDAGHVVSFCVGVLLVVVIAHDRPAAVFAPLAVAHLLAAGALTMHRAAVLTEARP